MATPADFARIGNYAIMHNPQKNIDRSFQHRTVPMEVLSLGYSRTGTLSMRLALEILGYPNPYHFSSFWDNVVECDMWTSALRAKYYGKGPLPDKAFFDGLLGHVGAVTDLPCNLFAAELTTFYPDAKVVLVEREIESWFASWYAFCENAYDPLYPWLAMLDPGFCARILSVGTLGVHPHAGFATNLDQVRVRSRDAYRHHYRDVRDMVPKENLLNFQLKDGWEPLCKFLGRPVPTVPFPHVNDKEANAQAFKDFGIITIKRILRRALVLATVIGVPAIALYWYRQR